MNLFEADVQPSFSTDLFSLIFSYLPQQQLQHLQLLSHKSYDQAVPRAMTKQEFFFQQSPESLTAKTLLKINEWFLE